MEMMAMRSDETLMGSWEGAMGPLLMQARAGLATAPSERERCKTSTRGITAKTEGAKRIQYYKAPAGHHKIAVAVPAAKRDFMRTSSSSSKGTLITVVRAYYRERWALRAVHYVGCKAHLIKRRDASVGQYARGRLQ